jgi:hypothetical protein
MYFCRRGVNDIHWIIKKMRVIPEDRRQEVTNQYEKLLKFNDGYPGRDAANKYLQSVAEEYRPERPERVIKMKAKSSIASKKPEQKYNSKDGLWKREIN